jgi:hypothetical protein
MAWILTQSLVSLRDAFNKRFPKRDKTTDGSIGNQAHAGTTSSHNPDKTGDAEVKDGDAFDEVRAIDVDADLKESGVTMLMVIAAMLADKAAEVHHSQPHHLDSQQRVAATAVHRAEPAHRARPLQRHFHRRRQCGAVAGGAEIQQGSDHDHRRHRRH